MHVLTLVVALPLIGLLSGLLEWSLGGTGWQIAGAVLASSLVVQGVYVAQLLLRYRQLDREPARGRAIQGREGGSSARMSADRTRGASHPPQGVEPG